MKNIQGILSAVKWDIKNLVKVRIYVTDMSEYGLINEVYGAYFTENLPARAVIGVKELPLNASVEIECVARSGTAP